MKRMILLVFAVLTLLIVGSIVWLANARLVPPSQKVEQAIPDDHIPR